MPTRRVLDQVRCQLRLHAVVFNRPRDEFRDRAPAAQELSTAAAAPLAEPGRLAPRHPAARDARDMHRGLHHPCRGGGRRRARVHRPDRRRLAAHARDGVPNRAAEHGHRARRDTGAAAVTLAATLSLLLRRRVAHAALMVAALTGGQALNWALKAAFERPRPTFSDPLATATGFSFPSGHAMVSLTVYGALAFVTAASAGSRRAQLLALLSATALVLAIGFSRVYLGVHYATDVLAAYSAGVAWLALCALTLLGASRVRVRKRRSTALLIGSRLTALSETGDLVRER
jgi:PAP2 superfamily protein